MITVLALLVLGALLGIGGLFAWFWLTDLTRSRAQAKRYAWLERQRSEARIQQITQDAVQQMLNVSRRTP